MSNVPLHRLDPDDDVLLELRSPCAPFAVWAVSEEATVQDLSACEQVLPADQFAGDVGFEISDLVLHTDDSVPAPKEHQESNDICNEEPQEALDVECSPVRAELNGPWTEATADSIDGLRHIEASDWDDQALLLLMRVRHGLNREVPRKITLEMLAKIAVLVDYYDCHEAVELAVNMWIDAFKDSRPLDCNRDLPLWLLISSTFRQPETFRSITKTAIQESRAPLPALDLPISQNVIGKSSFTQDGAQI
ncbi:hypothetical protein J7T55_011007 [Diaporthe amygdali]|uniref:uncharacterized protein n=1 Tax=Phomopsis amygdali TaxID=1214568 RepID=UPI0022FE853E|nr:uncharacterized protein J7T55_011007 [Diaporthe amygdali]KAJ0103737.1 hypothetical protein J7T55_011007 [Diaporthe amygdali]